MRFLTILAALCASVFASSPESQDSVTISIQPITASPNAPPPTPLAEISYNPTILSSSLISYSPPDLSPSDSLLRVGIYDPVSATWKSSTSTTSVKNFAKGYRPTIVLNLDGNGSVLGVSVKAAVIDAGQTRDFSPRVMLRGMGKVRGPELNRPVVLNPEGKIDVPEPEKTMFQKYWWVGLAGVMLLMTAGGGGAE